MMKLLVLLGLVAAAQGSWHRHHCEMACPEGQVCRMRRGEQKCVEPRFGKMWRHMREKGEEGSQEGSGEMVGHMSQEMKEHMKERMEQRHHGRWAHHRRSDDDDDNDDAHDDDDMGETLGGIAIGTFLVAVGFALGVAWNKRQVKQAIIVQTSSIVPAEPLNSSDPTDTEDVELAVKQVDTINDN